MVNISDCSSLCLTVGAAIAKHEESITGSLGRADVALKKGRRTDKNCGYLATGDTVTVDQTVFGTLVSYICPPDLQPTIGLSNLQLHSETLSL